MPDQSPTPPLDPSHRRLLPEPLRDEPFALWRRGISDNPAIDVYRNEAGDFVALSPTPTVDYVHYQPRHQRLGLSDYKKSQRLIEVRYGKIRSRLQSAASVLEVGAAEGAFLAHLAAVQPGVALASVEPDESTRVHRDAIAGLRQFPSLEAAAAGRLAVDVVCLFHVFEHLADPASFLSPAKRVLAPGGRLIIEVPSLDDPLLSLYQSAAYRDFYFQQQHPFVYSASSLRRVLEHHGFTVEIVPYQRYGLENHLAWLANARPGGSPELRQLFGSCEQTYIAALEQRGFTDTVFAIAQVPA